jgi:GntR family transcriptional regulator/MocR family aminotransferase
VPDVVGPIHVSLGGREELSAGIYRQLREAVLDGRFRPGERLPPSRELAGQLGVARNTVATVYERLTAEGFLTARVGSGTFVADRGTPRSRRAPIGPAVGPRPVWAEVAALPPLPGRPFDFRVGVPDWRLFPLQTWRRLVNGALRAAVLRGGDYRDPAGYPPLRAAIARYIAVSRSVHCAAEDVLVTHGAQQAVDLIVRVLVEPGTTVAVEEPGYPPVRALLRAHGARVVGIPVDAEGIVVSAIPRAARMVYVTPSHQFPLGAVLSAARRAALLDWARRRGGVIVEDDYDSEFRFTDRPLEPLQSLDDSGRVIYVGTFSKTLLPMLRVGFLVAPASLQPALVVAKELSDWRGDLTTQVALHRFIDDGLLGRHIRRATRQYRDRRTAILDRLGSGLADWLEPVPSAAGLHVCALARPGVRLAVPGWVETLERYSARSAAHDGHSARSAAHDGHSARSAVPDGHSAGGPPTGIVLGFGAIQPDQIGPGLTALRTALRRGR